MSKPLVRGWIDAMPKRMLIYVLGGYVLLQFVWWAYMLVDLNGEIYQLRLELLRNSGLPSPEELILKAELDQRLSKRIWMVLGEGAVFMLLLALGFRAVQRSIVRELQLAAQQRNFLLSVTHELKSPIAAIRLQLQTLAERDLPEDKRQHLYGRGLADTDRLQGLVENLLLVNRVEAGKFPVHREPTDLGALVQRICQSHFGEEMESGNVKLYVALKVNFSCDADAMRSIVVNLVENGLKYGGGSPVEVSLSINPLEVRLAVTDGGRGVPKTDRERIFQRFFRLGNEDTRATKGTGIGLYLVRQLVEMHGGEVWVEDNERGGASFQVRFPLE
jgi:signal transduction histidine kinase